MSRVREHILDAIYSGAFPGAAVAIGVREKQSIVQAFGHYTYSSQKTVETDSQYDIASLTKVVATTTSAMILLESKDIGLDSKVSKYIPSFSSGEKSKVTIKHLLTHTSGLPSSRDFYLEELSSDEVVNEIKNENLEFSPGSKVRYSDIGMIILGLIIEIISGTSLQEYAKKKIFDPLGMKNTVFRPVKLTDTDVVPTEDDDYFRDRLIQGEVHDSTAWIMGGVAGHAGLFSTAEDLAIFAEMMVNRGEIRGKQFLRKETIDLFTSPQAIANGKRALGWKINPASNSSAAGGLFSEISYGHNGFTGTSLWIDPINEMYFLLLSNRVYPTRDNSQHLSVRSKIADTVYSFIMN